MLSVSVLPSKKKSHVDQLIHRINTYRQKYFEDIRVSKYKYFVELYDFDRSIYFKYMGLRNYLLLLL